MPKKVSLFAVLLRVVALGLVTILVASLIALNALAKEGDSQAVVALHGKCHRSANFHGNRGPNNG